MRLSILPSYHILKCTSYHVLRCSFYHVLRCTSYRHTTIPSDTNVLANCLKDIVCYRHLLTPFNLPFKFSSSLAATDYHINTTSPTAYATNMSPKRVCIIGSGNWGSAIAKIAATNVSQRPNSFEHMINMYMYEEIHEGQKLTEIFNTTHINVKYLPGTKIPDNVIAVPDVVKATEHADILIFVLPHQFVQGICSTIKGNIKPGAIAISLIKGFDMYEGGIRLLSEVISENLGIECAVLMGANIAHEVASELFCEATIGAKKKETGLILKSLFDMNYFRCSVVEDCATVEACGALKNIVAVGAGIADGHNFGNNTKAAIIRLGMLEMIEFISFFFKESNLRVYFESCGLADLITTCQGGRNRKLGVALVCTNKSLAELEEEILKGQSFQGPLVAKSVYDILKMKKMADKYPLFIAVHLICQRKMKSSEFVPCLMHHPEYKSSTQFHH